MPYNETSSTVARRQVAAVTSHSRLDVMNFLNEASEDFPQAISFASGRPAERFFDIHELLMRVPDFIAHWSEVTGRDRMSSTSLLGQYGATNGIICDIVARQLAIDEGIACKSEQILITGGCQEALLLCCRELCEPGKDVIIVRNPTYIGITGVADLSGLELWPMHERTDISLSDALNETIELIRLAGKRPRLLYLIPDFDNPTGVTVELHEREMIIQVCGENEVFILEDNPYGMFRFEGMRLPSMFSLDKYGCVIYLGTYSKTLCPSVRVGFLAVPPMTESFQSASMLANLSRAKSFGSLNTSQLVQAAVGGLLISESYTLIKRVSKATEYYKRSRNRMIDALRNLRLFENGDLQIGNNSGGFFLTLDLPFAFGQKELQDCAREHNVLVMPLSFFAFDESHNRRIRLAYSNVEIDQIDAGIEKFSQYLSRRI